MKFTKLFRFFLSTVLLVVFSLTSQAQEDRYKFGMKFSGNISWISPQSSNIAQNGTGFGYSYGVMGDFFFSDNYSVNAEVLITHLAGGIEHLDSLIYLGKGYDNVTYDYRFQYLQIPISIKFHTKQVGYMSYWAQFGLAPSILLGARADVGGPLIDGYPENTDDIRVNHKAADDYHFANFDDKVFPMRLPLIIGGGFNYQLAGDAQLHVGLRIDNGFTNFLARDDVSNARLSYASITTGVFF